MSQHSCGNNLNLSEALRGKARVYRLFPQKLHWVSGFLFVVEAVDYLLVGSDRGGLSAVGVREKVIALCLKQVLYALKYIVGITVYKREFDLYSVKEHIIDPD